MLKLKGTVMEVFGLLHNFALLWEQELSQIVNMQNQTLISLENTTVKNKASNRSFEAKVKTEMIHIRQGINEETLKKQLNGINIFLNSFKEKYE